MQVMPINKKTANEWIMKKHYKHSLGVFWEGYALVINGYIEGVVCYGQPSAPIQKYAFKDRNFRLYELTRLVIQTDRKNAASFLIGNSLKMLKSKPAAIISYADTAQNHCGYIYQATNWIYTGEVKAHDKMYIIDGFPTHPITIRDKFGITSIAKWAKENGIKSIPPKGKHRYFYFIGDKREKREMIKKLKYQIIESYPKMAPQRYNAGEKIIQNAGGFEIEI